MKSNISGFIHLKKPQPDNVGMTTIFYVVGESPYSDLYLQNTGILSTVAHCPRVRELMYYDNESEAYAAMSEYYEFNKQDFPYTVEMDAAMINDGYILGAVSEQSFSFEEKVESQVMEF